MSLAILYTSRFKKDAKLMKKSKNFHKLQVVIDKLIHKKALEPKYRDHTLIGNYAHHRECYIEPDWLLVYKLTEDSLILERTSSHSDLFR